MKTNTGNHAERELSILLKTVEDPIIKNFIPEILALCDKFGASGHSGGSTPYAANALSSAIKKLCLQEPICDITGIDEEWNGVGKLGSDEIKYQNNRLGSVFKGSDGICIYLDAIVWKTQTGSCWSGTAKTKDGLIISSKKKIKQFPFKPKTFYIDVIETEVAKDDWEFIVKNDWQLNAVKRYYDF